MSIETYLPPYEEVTQELPPPPPYTPRDGDIPLRGDNVYGFCSNRQMLVRPALTRTAIDIREPKHWTSRPCFSICAYGLAIFSCLFCGCMFGILALIFLYIGEKEPNRSISVPNGNKYNRKFVFLVISVFFAFFGIISGITIVSIVGVRLYNMSLQACRHGESTNGTCCEQVASTCDSRLFRTGPDGCHFCCTSEICINHLKEIQGCPRCEIYSDHNDWNGCPQCCLQSNKSCGIAGKYRSSSGCDECCPLFDEKECLIHGTSLNNSTGCKLCCPSCQINSTLQNANGCFRCCNKTESCGKQGTYLDGDGCPQCCKPHIRSCSFYSVMYKTDICRQCCYGPPRYLCDINR